MFTTVRYFIKTGIIFLITGLLTGLHMTLTKYVFKKGFGPELLSAHTHIILIGFVLMMIMGVALWFFPRAEKTDTRYNPDMLRVAYWTMTIATAARFISQIIAAYVEVSFVGYIIAAASVFQLVALGFFFYSIWGRIRPVGSHIREAMGEKF
jgi:heme/copper-type cytochrome/quinol oxidase subunit 1